MPGDFQLEYPVLQMRWTIDLRPELFLSSYARSIATFTFQGLECRLVYILHREYYDDDDDDLDIFTGMINDPPNDPRFRLFDHRLLLDKFTSRNRPHPPFVVSVHVEADDGTEWIVVEGLSYNRRIGSGDPIATIWDQTNIDVKRIHPNFRRSRDLRFLVELKKDNGKNSATQTNCSIPACYQLHCMDNLSEDFAQLKLRGLNTDVEFRCEGRSFKAHEKVVCARSPVIAAMLSSDMVERRTRVIKIQEMSREVFHILLWYLYTAKTPELTFELAWTLYESADQYAVLGLARRCSRYLVEQLSEENVWDVLVLANAHSDEGFVEEVVDYMVGSKTLKTSDRWRSFSDEHPILAKKFGILKLS